MKREFLEKKCSVRNWIFGPRFVNLAILVIFASLLLVVPTHAQTEDRTYVYDEIDVKIEILENSNMIIEETLTYQFDGVFRGVFREITTQDYAAGDLCNVDPTLQCGGFDRLDILEVRGNEGQLLQQGADYTVSSEYNSLYSEQRANITWIFAEDGRDFDNEKFEFTVKYEVEGGVGFFNEYDLFYWDVFFPDRDVNINSGNLEVIFPADFELTFDNLAVFATVAGTEYDYVFDEDTNSFQIGAQDLVPYNEFTVAYKIPKGILKEPGDIDIDLWRYNEFFPSYIRYSIDNLPVYPTTDGIIEDIPEGTVTLKVWGDNHRSFEQEVEIKSGEMTNVNVRLSPTPLFAFALVFFGLVNIIGLIFVPLAPIFAYVIWRRKGRDESVGRTTVVPEFSPPEKIPPYLVGSLQDEKVDLKDITSVLIDTAYRGYMKIIELNKKSLFKSSKFEFKKLKDFNNLEGAEKKILKDIFGYKDRVTTSDLTNKFYTKLPGIRNKIYNEMVTAKYFNKRPDKVRNNYYGWGGALIMISIFVFNVINAFLFDFGLPFGFIGIQVFGFIFGIGLIAIANYMPAKTAKGSEIARRMEGFKMYLHHAERYRLQDLTPDTFEKFLSYAVVFGVEQEWAKTFENIYQGKPSWYEGQGDFNTLHFINSISRMNNATASSMNSRPSSSGSSYSGSSFGGGGFSSGGGFSGGFSGGGGGGGGGGAF